MEDKSTIFYFVTSKGKVKQLVAVEDDGVSPVVICDRGTGYSRAVLYSTEEGAVAAKIDELSASVMTTRAEIRRLEETVQQRLDVIATLRGSHHGNEG